MGRSGCSNTYIAGIINGTTTGISTQQRWEWVSNSNVEVDIFGDTHAARAGTWQLGAWNTDVSLAFVVDNQANIQAGTSNRGIFLKGSDANVGIGTASPGEKLTVTGGHISATSGNIHTNRGMLAFSYTATDTNHTIYNNISSILKLATSYSFTLLSS